MVWFEGKVALVTGAGMGIGRETAGILAAQGASVMCADIDAEAAADAAESIKASGGSAASVKVDVAEPEQCELMVAATVKAFGGLHLAVNNAGVGQIPPAPLADHPVELWRRIVAVNLDGVFYSLKYEIPEILKVGGGAIVNVSSILGLVAFPTCAAYVSSKHGVVGLTKTAALDYAEQGIRVNAVNPGFVLTPMNVKAGIEPGTELYDLVAEKHAMKRWGTEVEIANGIAWLLSDEASFVTGMIMPIDGGYTAQ